MASAVPITSTPATGQLVEHNGETYDTIREGRAYILIPPNTQTAVDPQSKANADGGSSRPQKVFYNPIQQFNRDLSVLAIKAFGEDLTARRELTRETNKDKNKEKNERRNARKRKREADNAAKADPDEGGVKLQKASDGQAMSTERGEMRTAREPDGGVYLAGTGATLPSSLTEGDLNHGSDSQPARSKGPSFRILDALSASGLRALRYAREIPFVTAVVANDMNPNATRSIAMNVQHNDLASSITTNTGDAIGHMYSVAYPPTGSHGPHHLNKKYDVVDLDPYGTAAPFLDSALQATNDGGLLCVTCTDSGVFASTGYCEKTYSLYGGLPAKGTYMHEAGLRLVIHSVASTAAKYGISIEPVLSLSIDFYVRIFVRIRKSPADVKFLAGKTMIVYCCDHGCGAWATNLLGRNTKQESKNGTTWYKHSINQAPVVSQHCEHCGAKTHIAGPMWAGPIHNAAFIEKILDDLKSADPGVYSTIPRIEGMLTTALDELLVNDDLSKPSVIQGRQRDAADCIPKIPPDVVDKHPFYFNPSGLAKVLHCVAPGSAAMNGALRHAGYVATRSHCQGGSIKTNAPWTVIWEIMREWVRQRQPIKQGALKEGSAGYKIMQAARQIDEGATGDGTNENTPDIITESPEKANKTSTSESIRDQVVFDEKLGKDKPGKRLVRYQQNPRENWGPMTKAKGASNASNGTS